tara:strand:- start:322 stop:558 length:237 start_codon:yes stop_codon:yes gene_type:complete
MTKSTTSQAKKYTPVSKDYVPLTTEEVLKSVPMYRVIYTIIKRNGEEKDVIRDFMAKERAEEFAKLVDSEAKAFDMYV